jgi:hypothetical protein
MRLTTATGDRPRSLTGYEQRPERSGTHGGSRPSRGHVQQDRATGSAAGSVHCLRHRLARRHDACQAPGRATDSNRDPGHPHGTAHNHCTNITAPATTTAHTRRCRNPPRTPILTGRQSRTSQFRRERQGRPGTGSPAYQLIGVLSAALWMRENGLSSGYPAQSWCGRARISVWGSGAADRNYGLVLRARESDSSTLQAPPDGAW